MTEHKVSFDGGVQVVWDATSLDLAQTCMRKYYYSMILGIKPKNKSVHLVFGGIYAGALEHFYKLRATGAEMEDAIRDTIHFALKESWDAEQNKPIAFNDARKTRPALIRSILGYLDKYGNEESSDMKTHQLPDGTPGVELSFTFNMENNIVYAGHLDRVVTYGDEIYIMDQKTTNSTLGSYYFRRFDLNNQMSGYSLAGKIVFDAPVSGVIIDAAQILANETRYERGITTRNAAQLDEWKEGTIGFIEYAQNTTEEKIFPMNPNSCGNYGGCPFKDLCSVSPSMREKYIKTDYEDHNWDPANRIK